MSKSEFTVNDILKTAKSWFVKDPAKADEMTNHELHQNMIELKDDLKVEFMNSLATQLASEFNAKLELHTAELQSKVDGIISELQSKFSEIETKASELKAPEIDMSQVDAKVKTAIEGVQSEFGKTINELKGITPNASGDPAVIKVHGSDQKKAITAKW